MTSGTVKTRCLPVFCSVISSLYLSPSRTMSQSRSFNISLIRKPRLPSKTSAVAIRSLGRQPQKPSFIVCMISLYCSVVSATVFLFIMPSKAEKFVFSE